MSSIADTYRAAFDALKGGDPSGFIDMLADDVTWHQIGAETLHGKDTVAQSMLSMEGMDFDIDLHDAVANDKHLVGLVTARVDVGGGQTFTYRTAEIAHFDGAGKVTERWAFSDDTHAIVQFFAQF